MFNHDKDDEWALDWPEPFIFTENDQPGAVRMFDHYSDGYCPQCALQRQQQDMRLNRDDYWECPVCHLQAAGSKASFMILRERGTGDFREPSVSATEHVSGAFVTKQSADDPRESDGWFKDEAELRQFIEHEVN